MDSQRIAQKSTQHWQFIFSPWRSFQFAAALLAAFLSTPALLPAASLGGSVRNGTTNRPVAGAKVSYIQLQQGMTPVASADTDAQGVFRIDGVEAFGGSPALLQVEYQGATYSQPVVSPQGMAGGLQILVYDSSREKGIVAIRDHAIFLRPAAGELAVIEQISLENRSNPPRTYVNPEGTFAFSLPAQPRDGVQASIMGSAGMPIPQVPTPLEPANSFAINYPIRPGGSQVRLQYSIDYQSPYRFSKILNQPAEQTHIVTPGEGVQLSGENLTALGKEPSTGMLAYQILPAAGVLKLDISGEAPATQADSQTAEPAASGALTEIPDAATERRWLILSALGLILLGGLVYLYRS